MPRIRTPLARVKLPDPPMGELPMPKGYPERLDDSWAIAQHIVDVSPGDIDFDFVEQYFKGAHAALRYVPLVDLSEGNADGNQRVASKEKAYAKLPAVSRPPIVVQDGGIEDGNHRYRVAKAAGETGMWAYVIEDDE